MEMDKKDLLLLFYGIKIINARLRLFTEEELSEVDTNRIFRFLDKTLSRRL
jgi:hypothetical protein